MKRILLLRHAKSSWDFPHLSDSDRPLNDRGFAAASRMGLHLQDSTIQPDLVLTSPAIRARDTAERVIAELSQPPDIRIDARLYLSGAGGILETLREIEPQHRTVMVVGHNPSLQELAIGLANNADSPHLPSLSAKFPTCALAEFEVDIARWDDLQPSLSRLVGFTPIRSLE